MEKDEKNKCCQKFKEHACPCPGKDEKGKAPEAGKKDDCCAPPQDCCNPPQDCCPKP